MEYWELAIVLLAAIVPSLIYLAWIRNSELYNRERWGRVLSVYLFGAVVSIMAALLLESVAIAVLYTPGSLLSETLWDIEFDYATYEIIILAVVIAPLVEEWTKGWGVMATRNHIREPEDGLIYGAAAGLGFAATENIFYNSAALLSGLDVFLSTALLRAVTSTLLHASASAVLGYGISRKFLLGMQGVRMSWLPYYLAAVLLHAVFNGFAVLSEVVEEELIVLLGLAAALVLAVGMFLWLRRSVQVMDRG